MSQAQEPTNYRKMSLKQLKTLLKSMKVKGVSRLNKKQMLSLLNQREAEQKIEESVKELTPEPTPMKKSKTKKSKTKKSTKKSKATPKLTEEPNPEPVKESTPEPVKESTPEPVKESTPELVKELTPEPVKEQKPVGKMSLNELKDICRKNKIKGFSKMKKSVIVALLTPLFFAEEEEPKEYVHVCFDERDDVAESRDYLNTMNLKTLRTLSKKYKLKKYSKLNRKDIITLIETRKLVTADEKVMMKLKKKDLKKLKSICKTIKFKGYSKLNKKSMIDGIMSMNK